jgi:magnesium transporter
MPQSSTSWSRDRAIWLGINLLTAFLAAWVIGQFEATLEQVVALAVLMQIIASIGGIAATQASTLIVRGIALGQVSGNVDRLFIKEVVIACLNGLLWALAVGVEAWIWFDLMMIGVVIAAAMMINLVAAALAGVAVPLPLKRFHIDPAPAGSVVVTMVTFCIGFFAYLGLWKLPLLR